MVSPNTDDNKKLILLSGEILMNKKTTTLSLISVLIFTIFLASCSKSIDRHNVVIDDVKVDVQKTKIINPHTAGNETSSKHAIAILYEIKNNGSKSINPDRIADSKIYPYQKLKKSNKQLTENVGSDLDVTLDKGQSAKVTRIYQLENTKDPVLLKFKSSEKDQDLILDINKSDSSDKNKSQNEKKSKKDNSKGKLPDGVEQFKTYNTNWSDNSWSGVTVKIPDVNVGKFTEPQDINGETAQGTIIVNFEISTTDTDINIYPNQSELLTNNGNQIKADLIESDSTIGGEYMAGSKKKGQVVFLIENMNDIKEITSLRLKFLGNLANNDTDEIDVYNYTHDYDTGTLELN